MTSERISQAPMTADEWQRQTWPPCPVCSTPIVVERIDVTTAHRPTPRVYVAGRWECPNGCRPR